MQANPVANLHSEFDLAMQIKGDGIELRNYLIAMGFALPRSDWLWVVWVHLMLAAVPACNAARNTAKPSKNPSLTASLHSIGKRKPR